MAKRSIPGQTLTTPAGATAIAQGAADTTGGYFIFDEWPRVYTYNGPNGVCDTITATDPGDGVTTFRKTYTYTNGNLTASSGWVKQ